MLLLHPKDYGFPHEDVPLDDEEEYLDQLGEVLAGETSSPDRVCYLEWRLLPVALWSLLIPWEQGFTTRTKAAFGKGA